MGNPLDSSQFVRLLDKRLRDVGERRHKELPSMISTFFNVMSSDSAWEEFLDIGAVPDIPEFNGKISYLPVSPEFHRKIEHKEYAGGIIAERKLIDDKKYAVLDSRAAGLIEAAGRSKEKLGVRLFANSASSAFDFMTNEEGVALVSSSHASRSGASTSSGFDNAGTSAASKTAVAATRIIMRGFKNDIGERVEIGDNLAIVCPDNLADTFDEIVGTPKGYETANHTMNNQYGRFEVIPYLRLDDFDTNNWYMVDKDMMKRDALWFNRINPEISNTVDYETYALKTSVYYRCSYGYRDWRWIYGQIVS
jgi:hypothetical protein